MQSYARARGNVAKKSIGSRLACMNGWEHKYATISVDWLLPVSFTGRTPFQHAISCLCRLHCCLKLFIDGDVALVLGIEQLYADINTACLFSMLTNVDT